MDKYSLLAGTTGVMDYQAPSSTIPQQARSRLLGASRVVATATLLNSRAVLIAGGAGAALSSAELFSMSASAPLYNVCLLYDSNKAVNSGATLPIKLHLCNASGNNVSSSTITLHATGITKLSDLISGQVQASRNANPDSNFRFDGGLGPNGAYIFNLSTKGLTTGSYTLRFTVTGDTAIYNVPFH